MNGLSRKVKWTTPKEMGLPFPEMQRIFVGDCGAPDVIHCGKSWDSGRGGAHTHSCPQELIYNNVCISDENELLNFDGSPSDLIWHEYGHVLWDFPEWVSNWRCIKPVSLHSFSGIDYFDHHDETWKNIMINVLQKPHLTTQWVYPSIKMAQAAAQIK